MKELEKKNARLKRLEAEQAPDQVAAAGLPTRIPKGPSLLGCEA